MKILLSLLLFCALLPAARAQGGGLSNIFRSVTSAIGGKEPAPAQNQTAVLGVRGMDEGGTKAAAPADDDLKLLDSWAVGHKEAEAAAARRGLTARAADYEKDVTDNTKSPGAQ